MQPVTSNNQTTTLNGAQRSPSTTPTHTFTSTLFSGTTSTRAALLSGRASLVATKHAECMKLAGDLSTLCNQHKAHVTSLGQLHSNSEVGWKKIKDEVEELNDRVDELEEEIVGGSQSKEKTLEILNGLTSFLNGIIKSLTDWDKQQKKKTNDLIKQAEELQKNAVGLNSKLKELGGKTSSDPTKASTISLIDAPFKAVLNQLEALKKTIDDMTKKLTGGQAISLPSGWKGEVMRALDEGIKALNKQYQDAIQKLQQKMKNLSAEITEAKVYKLQSQILFGRVSDAVNSINDMGEAQVVQAISEAYGFDRLETVIDVIKGVKTNEALYNTLRKTLTTLKGLKYWKPEMAPKDLQEVNNGKKTKTIYGNFFKLEPGRYEVGYHYCIFADTVQISKYSNPERNLTIKARRLVVVYPEKVVIDLSGKKGAPFAKAAASGTEKDPDGKRGAKGKTGGDAGNLSLTVGAIVDTKGNPATLRALLNAGNGGVGQKSGDGFSPQSPSLYLSSAREYLSELTKVVGQLIIPKPKGPPNPRIPGPITVNVCGGQNGIDGSRGGHAFKGGASGDPGSPGKITKVGISEDLQRIVVGAERGKVGARGKDGTPGKGALAVPRRAIETFRYNVKDNAYEGAELAAFKKRFANFYRDDFIKKYLKDYLGISEQQFYEFNKNHPEFFFKDPNTSLYRLKDMGEPGQKGSDGKLKD